MSKCTRPNCCTNRAENHEPQQSSEGVVVDAAKCPECDGITLIDEDGCCRTCGADTEPCKAQGIGPLEEAE